MELPSWTLHASGANSYVAGVAKLELGKQRVSLLWWRGKQLPGFDVHATAARLGKGTRVIDLAPPGVVGYTMETPLGDHSRFMSLIKCDGRMIDVTSMLGSREGLAIHSSMIRSFHCVPESDAATRPDPKFITIPIPSSWSTEVSPPGQVPTTVYGSVAEAASIMVETHPDLDTDASYNVSESAMKQMKAVLTDPVIEPVKGTGRGSITADVRFTATMHGVPVVGYATAIHCAKLQAVGFILGLTGDAAKADEIYATIKQAVCIVPTSPTPPTPPR